MRSAFDIWFPDEAYDLPSMMVGSASGLTDCDAPVISHPIGFRVRREKPRVRIKAWTRPILEGPIT